MSVELACFSPAELTAYLSQPFNAHVANEDRWYGMTHLHDACVKGGLAQVQILIRFNADVNVANAGGETPMHLAARRGIISITEELRKAGADFHALDQSGRTLLHFAAWSDNPSMIHYLLNFCRLDPWAKDKNGDTFFHLLCQNKKVEAVCYCLRTPLVTATRIRDLRNAAQRNPFDLSLDNSTAEIPYLLLNSTEFSLLASKSASSSSASIDIESRGNGDGFDNAPSKVHAMTTDEAATKDFDYVAGLSSPRASPDPRRVISSRAKSNPSFAQLDSSIAFHRRISRLLRRSDSRPLLGPYPAYSLLLLKPFLFPPLLFLFCRSVVGRWTDYGGGFFYLVAFYFAWSHKSENYRMNHVGKWPNPFMASLFFSGIFYDLIVFYAAIRPAIKTTTTEGAASGFWFDGFVVATTLTLTYQYLTLVFGDPGRARSCPWLSNDAWSPPRRTTEVDDPDEKSSSPVPSDDVDVIAGVFIEDHCSLCRVRSDAAAHVRHCRLCDVCVRGFDHHCLFLLTCVAEKNRRLFLAFLIFVDLVCIPTLLVCICRHLTAFSTTTTTTTTGEATFFQFLFVTISTSLYDSFSAMLIFLCLGNWIAWLWIAYLIYNQIYYVVRAHTTSCVGIKSCRDELNRKMSWGQFSTSLLYFLTKGEMLARNATWA